MSETGYVVEFVPSMRFSEGDDGVGLSAVTLARVHLAPSGDKRFPTQRARPHIALVGESLEDAVEQVRRWLLAGAPSMDEAKPEAVS